MPSINKPDKRILTKFDEEHIELQWQDTQRPIPTSGIFDEPARWHRLNHEWSRYVLGLINWLATSSAWSGSDEEIQAAIQAINEFKIGLDMIPCDEIEPCIENSTTITNITNNVTNIDNSISYPPANPSDITTPINNTTYYINYNTPTVDGTEIDCNDVMYGQIWDVINFIDQANKDVLERIANTANTANRAAKAIGSIPIIGLLNVDEILEFTATLINSIYTSYLSSIDQIALRDVSCEIFCDVQDTCTLSMSDIVSYFESKISGMVSSSDDIEFLINVMMTGSYTGIQYYYLICYFQLSIASLGGYFGKRLTPEYYELVMKAADNNSDHLIYCDCAPQLQNYDQTIQTGSNFGSEFTVIAGTLNATNTTSVYAPSVAGINNYGVSIEVEFDTTRIDQFFIEVSSYGTSGRRAYVWFYNGATQVSYFTLDWLDNQQIWLSKTSGLGVDVDKIVITVAFNGDSDTNSRLWKLRLAGYGLPPFQSEL